jgi:hypothetical protein
VQVCTDGAFPGSGFFARRGIVTCALVIVGRPRWLSVSALTVRRRLVPHSGMVVEQHRTSV